MWGFQKTKEKKPGLQYYISLNMACLLTDEHYLPPAAAMTQELLTSHIYRGVFFCNKKCKF